MIANPTTKEMIQIVAAALGELNDNAVFTGGATLPFYLPEAYLMQVRPTEDIDVVMEVVGYHKNSINEDLLRKKGFEHDTSEGVPICRWIYRGLKVDIMSTDSSAFGFTNIWYKEGFERAIEIVKTPETIRIFSLPYFIATKIEAFKGRGHGDFMASPDMEDIISVLEASSEEMFEAMLSQCSENLLDYIKREFQLLLSTSDFFDSLPGAIFNRNYERTVIQALKKRMERVVFS